MTRYTVLARWYDLIAAEWVYRAGRATGIRLLGLRPGDEVLDLGCGTGLNLPLLLEAVGPGGRVVGLDASPQMLAVARRRARARGADNVVLVRADATTVDPARIARLFTAGSADAVLSTYALSLMPDWRQAWRRCLRLAGPQARMAVVDMRLPAGRARLLAPLARLACALGGSDPGACPWTAVEADCREVAAAGLRGGHIQVRAGTLR